MDKGDKVEDIYRAAELLRKNGIEVGFFLQFGYPGEAMGRCANDIEDGARVCA